MLSLYDDTIVSMKEFVLGWLQVSPVLGILYGAIVAGNAKDDSAEIAGVVIMLMSVGMLVLIAL